MLVANMIIPLWFGPLIVAIAYPCLAVSVPAGEYLLFRIRYRDVNQRRLGGTILAANVASFSLGMLITIPLLYALPINSPGGSRTAGELIALRVFFVSVWPVSLVLSILVEFLVIRFLLRSARLANLLLTTTLVNLCSYIILAVVGRMLDAY